MSNLELYSRYRIRFLNSVILGKGKRKRALGVHHTCTPSSMASPFRSNCHTFRLFGPSIKCTISLKHVIFSAGSCFRLGIDLVLLILDTL